MSQQGTYPSLYFPITFLTGDNPVAVGPTAGNVNIVGAGGVTVTGNDITSTLTIAAGGGIPTTFTTDAGNAVPALNVLNVLGGTNIGTTGAGNNVTVNLDNTITLTAVNATTFDTNVVAAGVTLSGTTIACDGTDANIDFTITPKGTGDLILTTGDFVASAGNLRLPSTNAAGTQGCIDINLNRWLSSLGTRNTFLGESSGNVTLTVANAVSNTGVGYVALTSLTTGEENTAVGAYAGSVLDSGSKNVAIGNGALSAVTTGSDNIAIGNDAASALTVADHSNIIIGNIGTIADTHKIIIGTQGSNAGQQDKAYIAGIYGVTPAGTINVALVDSNGQLGSAANLSVAQGGTGVGTLLDHAPLLGSGTAAITSMAVGTNGETIMGSTGADCAWTSSPQFGGSVTALNDITSTAGSIVSIGASVISRDATNTAAGPEVKFQKVRVAAIIQTGDELGELRYTGYDGVGYITGAKISSTSSGTIGVNRVASDLKFYTHPDSVLVLPSEPLERMAITSAGNVSISAPDAGDALTVAGTVLATTFDTNVVAAAVTLSGTTLSADGTDAAIDINITPKGTADIVVSNGGIECSAAYPNSSIRSVLGYIEGHDISTITNPAIAITLNENGIYADGTDANVDVAVIAKGTGAFSIDGLWGGTLDSQYKTCQRSTTTADATPKILFTIAVAEKQMVTAKAIINGFKDDYLVALTGEVNLAVYRAPGGNVTIVGDKVITFAASGTSTASLDAAATVGTQTLDVLVVGVVAENWQWVTTVSYQFTTLP